MQPRSLGGLEADGGAVGEADDDDGDTDVWGGVADGAVTEAAAAAAAAAAAWLARRTWRLAAATAEGEEWGGRGGGGGSWPGSPYGKRDMAAARCSSGLCAIRIFSTSASCSRFVLARRFWNQILTCVSVRLRLLENSARSAMLRYCFSRNFFSRAISCCVVKGVRGFRLGLCFRSVHLSGPRLGLGMSGPEMEA